MEAPEEELFVEGGDAAGDVSHDFFVSVAGC